MELFNAELKIITPVIIHTGESYDFMNLLPVNSKVLSINAEKAFLYMGTEAYDTFLRFIQSGSDTNKEPGKRARDMLFAIAKEHNEVITGEHRASGGFYADIEKNPYAQVLKIYKSPLTGKPYIPGSSIKGVLRTAFFEYLRKERAKKEDNGYFSTAHRILSPDFETQIVKGRHTNTSYNGKAEPVRHRIKKDIFRFITISDFDIPDGNILFSTVRVLNRGSDAPGIPVYTEMTESGYLDKREITGKGRITIKEDFFKALHRETGNDFVSSFKTPRDVLKTLNLFYLEITDNPEHSSYARPDTNREPDRKQKEYINLQNKINKIMNTTIGSDRKNCYMMKLGRFTQVESKTFNIQRKGEKNGKYESIPEDINIHGGISRSLVDGMIPAGWCILNIKGGM
ncbi:MAG: type III-A CRISPR-associated RAMP protein Csm5 [Spirochaetales bacterium]|nr:type III-A CRISPR-associated RAMP protein Csm5 [Spirochaetales bacterium]